MAEAKAILRFARVAPRKARLVIDLIRGQKAGDALSTLTFHPRRASRVIRKVLQSAVANASQKEMGDIDDLWVTRAFVDGASVMKRARPEPQGRSHLIRKRSSHITLVLSNQPEPNKRS